MDRLFGRAALIDASDRAKADKWQSDFDSVARRHEDAFAAWEARRNAWVARQDERRAEIQRADNERERQVAALRARWEAGDAEAILERACLVLDQSEYSAVVPRNYDLAYHPETKTIVAEMQLPAPADIPTVKSSRFVATTGEIKTTEISQMEHRTLYEDTCYQICLRTIHELLEADTRDNLDRVVFNGFIDTIDPATDQKKVAVILSIGVGREEFLALNLGAVDPKACFKALKGTSAANLVRLAPVAPVVMIDRTDRRFIDGREVSVPEDGSMNLAAMDWEDFEHLVRDLFDRESGLEQVLDVTEN
jgi:restriction system protein